jgi:Condensation domain
MSEFSMQAQEALFEAKRRLLEIHLRGEGGYARSMPPRITPRAQGTTAPLSFAQEQLWIREQKLAGTRLPYNESVTIRANDWLDAAVVERCFAEIVRRHEIWRTTYAAVNGQPIQVIHPAPLSFPLRVVDLRKVPAAKRDAELLKLTSENVRQVFDLEQGPLLRVTLVRLTDTDQRLCIFAHLSILDGVSAYQILPVELAALYKAFSAGTVSLLPDLQIQYADYAYWQRRWLKGDELAKQLAYWQEQLTGDLPVLRWPADRPRSMVETYRGAIQPFAVSQPLTQALKEVSRREGVTLFNILLASLGTLLCRYTRQVDIIIGTPSPAGRKRSETQAMLGYFLNPVALRLNLDGNPTFRDLLARVQRVIAGAITYDDVPIELLTKQRKRPQSSDSPIFTIAISLQPQTPTSETGWQVTSMDAESGGSVWALYLAFIDTVSGMVGRAQYNPDIFSAAAIARVLKDLRRLMESVANDLGQRISALPPPLSGVAGLA